MTPTFDLSELLDALDPQVGLAHRHLWLIDLMRWIRGNRDSVPRTLARLTLLLDTLQQRPDARAKLQSWWQVLLSTVDATALLADYGFSSRNAFVSELAERLRLKWLPGTPETADASALFALVLCDAFDARWINALDDATLTRLSELLHVSCADVNEGNCAWVPQAKLSSVSPWQATLLEALTFCTSQIRATGFSPELRLRMSVPARETASFHALDGDIMALQVAYLASPQVESPARQHALQQYLSRLEACRHAAASVYTHLDSNGISVNLVFQLRQLRERVLRVRALLDCLLAASPQASTARLLAQLVTVGQARRSLRALISANSSMLAAKVAERSSETGEHYLTRTVPEYRTMLRQAAGGGALTAVTTWMKFGVMALGLSAFWSGFWSGAAYALSFVMIQLLHCTLATKQPAMTAPAMAAKLKNLDEPGALDAFADKVTSLVRSQVAAVLGNVLLVVPVVLLMSAALQLALGQPMIDAKAAEYVLQSLSLLGPTALFAAFTGVLLFASSIIAGWTENWFVLHRLDSAMRYNPKITGALGVARAQRWAAFMRDNISGFASNISLGFMLGLVPAFASFFGLGLDVRHVTLSAGQLAAAGATLGWDVLRQPALWWCVAAIPVIGALNLGVSFYMALRLAMRAHNVTGVDRARVRYTIWHRWRQAPLSFFWPARDAVPAPQPLKD
ncbi:MAG: site-specific recombinase [Gammaproteobacteria bacterium]|uniref:site-specific recombinase n=1 Tax=Rhodoferax sp. TaxID=50421 RepID=UPI0017F60E51|nr:site-specific recombinase [Rhodoferax sp.]MBU3900482.1 site-specific recombinase [Gammaproteobacteria bacterium]MBA3059949.1 recombinase [Rhodoferax sp.]MBU3997114.1 site-specific recombinase [Gammaproteobacteria bacterium]MBU4079927.1 site-specific recombinase [Gammaproteobacteria bacterium]MBU4112942.1 site-specific recombinase [Gammaproteobacteria bacterium]